MFNLILQQIKENNIPLDDGYLPEFVEDAAQEIMLEILYDRVVRKVPKSFPESGLDQWWSFVVNNNLPEELYDAFLKDYRSKMLNNKYKTEKAQKRSLIKDEIEHMPPSKLLPEGGIEFEKASTSFQSKISCFNGKLPIEAIMKFDN